MLGSETHIQWYISYYDNNNKYHSTKFFTKLKDCENEVAFLNKMGYTNIRIEEFRF